MFDLKKKVESDVVREMLFLKKLCFEVKKKSRILCHSVFLNLCAIREYAPFILMKKICNVL